MKSRRHIS